MFLFLFCFSFLYLLVLFVCFLHAFKTKSTVRVHHFLNWTNRKQQLKKIITSYLISFLSLIKLRESGVLFPWKGYPTRETPEQFQSGTRGEKKTFNPWAVHCSLLVETRGMNILYHLKLQLHIDMKDFWIFVLSFLLFFNCRAYSFTSRSF